VKVYHDHHAFVYPSWGEGFGLNPIQAMATGMPTITCPAWAPYARFINPNLSVGSELSGPPEDHPMLERWRLSHPGMMLRPNQDDLANAMRYVFENYDECVADAMDKVDEIKTHYSWDRLTVEAFKNLESRLENS
jgi:glycosyltransferase involved in cell wall biosynthesis